MHATEEQRANGARDAVGVQETMTGLHMQWLSCYVFVVFAIAFFSKSILLWKQIQAAVLLLLTPYSSC